MLATSDIPVLKIISVLVSIKFELNHFSISLSFSYWNITAGHSVECKVNHSALCDAISLSSDLILNGYLGLMMDYP